MTPHPQPSVDHPGGASRFRILCTSLVQWLDSDFAPEGAEAARRQPDKIDWMRCVPFIVLHVGCFGVKCTDEAIRANPYQSLAIAAGVGLLAGILLGRCTK